jgi:NADH:ubiquinone oxidoreductase subunit
MGIVKNIFTWWEGSTFGTWVHTKRNGHEIGSDTLGNIYYQATKPNDMGQPRRWVIYAGNNDASRVPPEWHGWLHNTLDVPPQDVLPAPRPWEADATPNLTGTNLAYRPKGASGDGRNRAKATGDYQAWSPDA